MSRFIKVLVGLVLVVGAALLYSGTYVVDETEQVVITQFGDPAGLGNPVTEPGLYFKVPFIQQTHYFDSRFLEWDGFLGEITTKDKRFIKADTYARWKIVEPVKFYKRVRSEQRAQSRLDDIIDGATRDAVASHDLLEIVRWSNRQPKRVEGLKEDEQAELKEIEVGRDELMAEILEKSKPDANQIGVELLDIRFKRINYNDTVRKDVYNRMIEERKRIAERYRSEGEARAADIRGKKEQKLQEIRSEAEKKAQKIRGEADGKATKIYADAYSKDAEFFEFYRTLEAYPKALDKDSWMLMSTESSFFKYLEEMRARGR